MRLENFPKTFKTLPDIDPPSLPKIPLKQKEKKDQIEHGSSFLHLFCFFLNLLLISGVQNLDYKSEAALVFIPVG